MTSISSNRMRPELGICSAATQRISVNLPAPFGPSRPNMPRGTSSVTDSRARVPFGYTCVSCSMESMDFLRVDSIYVFGEHDVAECEAGVDHGRDEGAP